jgi:hypothetical protein
MQLLRESGHQLQVELSALQGVALHAADPDPTHPPDAHKEAAMEAAGGPPEAAEEIVWGTEGEGSGAEGVSLLKGFVSFEQLAEYMEGGTFGRRRRREEEHTISMRGPGDYRRTSISGTTFNGKNCLSGTIFHAI